jgi:DNA polymerase-3 subunit delta'
MTVWGRLHESTTTDWIARVVSSDEVAHAWLLLGPPGSGKRLTAQAMAAALNCPVAPGTGCGECSTCLRTLRRRHPDVHHVVPEGPLIPVDIIREAVIPEAARSPFEGRRKVFIIEEADRMNDPAQNALLKTLEEPQPDTVFVLITDKEEDLLETIRSRCRVVRLEAVSEDRIVQMLRAEGVSDADSHLAARLSDGDVERARAIALDETAAARRRLWADIPGRLVSIVDALDAAEEILSEARSAVREREATQKTQIIELAEAMGEGRGTAAARNALAKRHRRELRRVEEEVLGEALHSLASFYRDVLVLRSGGPDSIVNLDLTDRLASWAASSAIEDAALVRIMERCGAARAALGRNANQLLVLEATLLEILKLAPAPDATQPVLSAQ